MDIKAVWKRNWVWMTAVVIGLVGAFVAAAMAEARGNTIQQGIAEQIIRFHVLANSNSDEDQELKMEVKETVVAYMKTLLEGADSVEASRGIIEANMDGIRETAEREIVERGYDYGASVSLTQAYFPVKTYGDCTFPAGDYEALQVRIGESKGRNWWCVVYPTLCFTDSIQGVVPEDKKEELKGLLTVEEYEGILNGGRVKIGFKWLGELGAGGRAPKPRPNILARGGLDGRV